MSADRLVPSGQHGTATGYRYGCRCDACRYAKRLAQREMRANRPERASDEAVLKVLEALEGESDMDGLVTASSNRIAELVGLSHRTAQLALDQLSESGRIRILGRVGRGGTFAVELLDLTS